MLVDYETALPRYCLQKGHVLNMEGIKQFLMCANCEKVLSDGEDYARRTLYGRGGTKIHRPATRQKIWYKQALGRTVRHGFQLRFVDFTLFKHFQIGVLWRCCVAPHQSFASINVSQELREQMRRGLQARSFEESFIPCYMEQLFGEPEACFGMLSLPQMHDGFVSMTMGGYVWHYQLQANMVCPFGVKKDGKLLIKITDLDVFLTPDSMLTRRR